MSELKRCPFCGKVATAPVTCGRAIPDCPRCQTIYGCEDCDVWFDSAEEWNTRNDRAVIDGFLARVRKRYDHLRVNVENTFGIQNLHKRAMNEVYAEMFPEN